MTATGALGRAATLAALLVGALALVGGVAADVNVYEPGDPRVGFILVSWADRPAADWEAAVQSLHNQGFREVSFVTYRFSEYDGDTGTFGTGISTTSAYGHARPSDTALAAGLQKAKELGMTVTLNPFVEVDAPTGIGNVWRGNLNFSNSSELAAWFTNYRAYLAEMADLAATHGVDRLMVGSELQGLSLNSNATTHWNTLIGEVRDAYEGRLSYAANWNWEYHNVPFWGLLDEIGIDAYFEIASEADALGLGNPSVETLVAGWQTKLSQVKNYAQTKGLPVSFSEIGYTYWDLTTAHPWNWQTSLTRDDLEQLNAYRAVITATDQQGDWLTDMSFWHWGMPGAEGSTYLIEADSLPGGYLSSYVPEPASACMILSGLGIFSLVIRSRRGKRKP